MIKRIKETLGQVFHSPEASGTWGDDITVNMDGGVGGSWKVECAIGWMSGTGMGQFK